MKTVVGLCGKMGSGKDTAAQILKLYGFKHLAFAWHIKKFAQEVFRLSDESLWGASNLRNEPQTVYLDSWGASYNFFQARKNFLTKLGLNDFDYAITESLQLVCDPFIRPNGVLVEDKYLTLIPRDILRAVGDWGRGIDQNLWVKATLKEADHFDKVVISDVRYQNEAEAINNFNHKSGVIKITRTNENALNNHSSELEQDSIPKEMFYYTINNNGSMSDLHSCLEQLVEVV